MRLMTKPVRCMANTRTHERKTLGVRSRRALLLGSLPIGVGAAVEIIARPDVTKPVKTRQEIKSRAEEAKRLLKIADEAYSEGKYSQAVDQYSAVIEAAPRNYVSSMKALLGRRDSYLALGLNKKASWDARREFAWGRGIRWPGWYIFTAILIRNQFVDD